MPRLELARQVQLILHVGSARRKSMRLGVGKAYDVFLTVSPAI
jgi:hypothetical protein